MAADLRSSRGTINGARLNFLILDGGRFALRNVFESIHPPNTLQVVFNSHYMTLQRLLTRRILTGEQWDLLFPPGGALPNSRSFDISLLFVLLQNICRLYPPAAGWDRKPAPTDKSREANLARIKWYRNKVYAQTYTTVIEDSLCAQYWVELSDTLVELGLDQSLIDWLKSASLDEYLHTGGLQSKWKLLTKVFLKSIYFVKLKCDLVDLFDKQAIISR